MSDAIWKFSLSVVDWCEFTMPHGSEILHLGVQNDEPFLWVKVNPAAMTTTVRRFRTYGTGHPMDSIKQTYVGTYMIRDGNLVFHVFEQAPQ